MLTISIVAAIVLVLAVWAGSRTHSGIVAGAGGGVGDAELAAP